MGVRKFAICGRDTLEKCLPWFLKLGAEEIKVSKQPPAPPYVEWFDVELSGDKIPEGVGGPVIEVGESEFSASIKAYWPDIKKD